MGEMTKPKLKAALAKNGSRRAVLRALGLPQTSANFAELDARMDEWELGFPEPPAKPVPWFEDEELLRAAIAKSHSQAQVLRELGRSAQSKPALRRAAERFGLTLPNGQPPANYREQQFWPRDEFLAAVDGAASVREVADRLGFRGASYGRVYNAAAHHGVELPGYGDNAGPVALPSSETSPAKGRRRKVKASA